MTHSATVISCFTEPDDRSAENHRRYARSQGYDHKVFVFGDGARGPRMLALYRYELLSETLSSVEPDQAVLLLSENSAVISDLPITAILGNKDVMLVSTASDLPQVNVQFWRNTPRARDMARQLANQCRLGGKPFVDEMQLLQSLPAQRWCDAIEGVIPVMHTGPNLEPRWSKVPTFALSIENSGDPSAEIGVIPRFRRALLQHINETLARRAQFFEFETAALQDSGERSTFNGGQQVAFVTLYTPEIATFATIAERNFIEYCRRQGYTLYVHRNIPSEIGLSGAGNWVKPWLLHAYLMHHNWVIWLDADVLFGNMNAAITPLLVGRDRLLVADVAQWPVNAGVIGFRRTEANLAMLHSLMRQIASLPDRSSVYSGNGDQYYIIESLRAHGMLDETDILSWQTINTPWYLKNDNSYAIHYLGMWWKMRAMMMMHDEKLRIQSNYDFYLNGN